MTDAGRSSRTGPLRTAWSAAPSSAWPAAAAVQDPDAAVGVARVAHTAVAGAGGAAHLPGMVAAMTALPVLGVPVESKALSGMDSLLSIVQMPGGVPVGTLAIGKAGAGTSTYYPSHDRVVRAGAWGDKSTPASANDGALKPREPDAAAAKAAEAARAKRRADEERWRRLEADGGKNATTTGDASSPETKTKPKTETETETETKTKTPTRRRATSCGCTKPSFSRIDAELVNLSANPRAFRFSEDTAFMEAMQQKAATTMFYGNKQTESESFTGLANRYGDLSADNADNIINAQGSQSDNTSIWLIGWDEMKTSLIFPKETKAGLESEDHGKQIVQDADSNDFTAWITEFNWRLGMQVRDWRFNARICNIDVSDLGTLANTKDLITWMIQASERIEAMSGAKFKWYVNRTIREKLRLGILEKIASNLSWETVEGKRVMMFDDIEVGVCDAILNTEDQVT